MKRSAFVTVIVALTLAAGASTAAFAAAPDKVTSSSSPHSVPAPPPSIQEQVRNHVTCYPFGIDEIGKGNDAAGIAIWRNCFASDFQFTIDFDGTPLICPGANCPLPAEMDSIEMRAKLAGTAFDDRNWIKTSHQLNNITVTAASNHRASVKAYVEAWHLDRNGSSVLSPGDWIAELVKTNGQWRIVKENLRINFVGVLQPITPPAPQPTN